MLRGLRLPLLVFFIAVIFLSVALYIRFVDGDGGDATDTRQATTVSEVTLTPSPTAVPATPTLAPTMTPPPPDKQKPVAGQLIEGVVGQINKLNPLYASYNAVDRDITALMFEGLTDINRYGEVVPDLAERWGASQDGLTYVFALRRDVLWHDGEPFTSADVKYTIDVIRSSDFQGNKDLTSFWRTVEMTVVDEYTVRFRLVQPLATFPEQLRVGILPQHVLAGYPVSDLDTHPFNLDPIGTGPYQFDNLFTLNGQIAAVQLRVAPVYHERQPEETLALDRLIFRTFETPEAALAAYLAGDINSVAHVPASFMNELSNFPRLAVHTTLLPSVGMLIYNWERDEVGYFTEQRARMALSRALDTASAVSQSLGTSAVTAQGPLIPGSWAYVAASYPAYDPTQARDMIDDLSFEREVTVEDEEVDDSSDVEPAPEDVEADEAAEGDGTGAENDEEGEPEAEDTAENSEAETTSDDEDETTETTTITMRRDFTILVLDRTELVNLADIIAAQWDELGFEVTVEAVDDTTYRQRLQDGDFDTAIVEYSFAPYADPDSYTFWHVGQYQDGLNYGGVRDLQISQMLEKARRETIGLNRTNMYHQFQELFAERVPALPLYHPVFMYLVDERLEGVQLGFITSPADRFRSIREWRWNLE